MKITSTNIAQPTTFIWNGKEITTGIYKKPTDHPIYLTKDNVKDDEVSDRKVHGGEFKACYLFSEDQYPYWQNLYAQLDWTYGMLGENLTVKHMDEKQLVVGDIYKLGTAIVQITQPREPCFKFAHKFGSNDVLKQFIDNGYSGTYVRVLEEGIVSKVDHFKLIEQHNNSISIFDFFQLLYAKEKDKNHIQLLIENDAIPPRLKKRLAFFLK
ncbi:MOSC domain-containing protein [Winogradskyella eckloniae]|uniref:MOSC domain-containing protein n=1 Tax=Winogradskyella eckloniae TaxID=1089306 RepID=UPI001564C873|nr:MOSC domain-containing protein [Winogradskyella eckloniae]NRD20622.1 MOSC domain-containing protein [Winogradskyella eckloniae]